MTRDSNHVYQYFIGQILPEIFSFEHAKKYVFLNQAGRKEAGYELRFVTSNRERK